MFADEDEFDEENFIADELDDPFSVDQPDMFADQPEQLPAFSHSGSDVCRCNDRTSVILGRENQLTIG